MKSNPKQPSCKKSVRPSERLWWKKMWNPRWRPRNGCDGRLVVKILITTIQVNFCEAAQKFTWIVIIKIFTTNLPSQPFLGRHLGFHIFFHHSLSEGRTLFLQLGCFGLDYLIKENTKWGVFKRNAMERMSCFQTVISYLDCSQVG